VLAAFARDRDGDGSGPERHPSLCAVACDLLSVSAVCITLSSELHRGRLCATDDMAAALDDLQFTTGQGPTIDACNNGTVVIETRMADAGVRWPAFASSAKAAGVGAAFAYPLRVGAARLGALTLYQPMPGPLTNDRRADAPVVADVLTLHVIAMQAGAGTGDLADGLVETTLHRAEVHQASGMVSVQLGVGITEALIRLRTYAYAAERPVAEVAADVISRKLRFDQ
jgi:hypothetical protein